MIWNIYLIILFYFLLGGIGFYLINRKKDPLVARKSYTKFIVYFFIVNGLFFSITIEPVAFRYLAVVITIVGMVELVRLFRLSGYTRKRFFAASAAIFSLLAMSFCFFATLNENLILFTFLVLSIFDAFSQITGQLWGKKKILPEISPNKTLGGLVGGACVALASAFLLRKLPGGSPGSLLFLAAGIILFAFLGDVAASYYKRKYGVKNFNNLIPGHGGFLDRFDSLIAGGAWVAWYSLLTDI
ncbi:putative phosphatidate cytidylyltransferase [Proteiniphilum saccharofermentans]|uniref:Putative phosphatidate cytidylyltransferase n=1 Tax=Proteiniphilum saccharofermentans TaxID=1642647 RepID=A0A1R3SXD0_9BACT|nr:phosphatidate cytidylyltransferase [Proteiniphilum saccharofermentans]SCD20923.1 putative phosphatidate cytidylyltransferase [Proteiniphilum saccharofermentans]